MLQHKLINWLLFFFLCLIWGSSFIIMKHSAETLSGWQIGAIRIFSAGLFCLPLAVFHIRSVPAKKIPLIILSGVLGNLFPAFLFAIAIEKKINSSLAGILNSLTPLLVIVIGVLLFKEKLQHKKMAGVVVGFVGLIILSVSKGAVTVDNFGFALLVLLATLCYALNVNMVSNYLQGVNPMKMATVSLAFMMLPAGIIAWLENVFSVVRYDEAARWPIVAIVLLGIVGSAIATAMFYVLIKRAGGLFASLVTYGIPVISIFWGLLDGENVSAIQLGCLGLILSGVYLANK